MDIVDPSTGDIIYPETITNNQINVGGNVSIISTNGYRYLMKSNPEE
jgi:hypothetical protein